MHNLFRESWKYNKSQQIKEINEREKRETNAKYA